MNVLRAVGTTPSAIKDRQGMGVGTESHFEWWKCEWELNFMFNIKTFQYDYTL